jgi:hypothetical protein
VFESFIANDNVKREAGNEEIDQYPEQRAIPLFRKDTCSAQGVAGDDHQKNGKDQVE